MAIFPSPLASTILPALLLFLSLPTVMATDTLVSPDEEIATSDTVPILLTTTADVTIQQIEDVIMDIHHHDLVVFSSFSAYFVDPETARQTILKVKPLCEKVTVSHTNSGGVSAREVTLFFGEGVLTYIGNIVRETYKHNGRPTSLVFHTSNIPYAKQLISDTNAGKVKGWVSAKAKQPLTDSVVVLTVNEGVSLGDIRAVISGVYNSHVGVVFTGVSSVCPDSTVATNVLETAKLAYPHMTFAQTGNRVSASLETGASFFGFGKVVAAFHSNLGSDSSSYITSVTFHTSNTEFAARLMVDMSTGRIPGFGNNSSATFHSLSKTSREHS